MVGGACASPTTLPGRHGDEGASQLQSIRQTSFVLCFHVIKRVCVCSSTSILVRTSLEV